jgi:hypothetical protein
MDIIGNNDVTGINRLRAIVTDFTELGILSLFVQLSNYQLLKTEPEQSYT